MKNTKGIFKQWVFGIITLIITLFITDNVKAESIKRCILDTYNNANNTSLTELTDEQYATITNLDCRGREITDASEISKLSDLTDLDLSNNQLINIDLSGNLKLVNLRIYGNKLTSLDLHNNTKIESLFIGNSEGGVNATNYYGNYITSIDLSNNNELKYFNAAGNKLTSLNLEGHTNLLEVLLQKNLLTLVNVKNCTNLKTLDIWNNKLTDIDLTTNLKLQNLYLGSNKVASIDLSKNTELLKLDLRNNELTNLDLSKNTKMTDLRLQGNKLTSLDLSKNTELQKLFIGAIESSACTSTTYGNNISSLDLSNNNKLIYINAAGNKLTTFTLTNHPLLEELYLQKNQISSINITNLPKLKNLYLLENKLTNIDVSNFTNLQDLNLATNSIASINLTNNNKLRYLNLTNNKLTSLDLSNNKELLELRVSSNKLASLDLTNNQTIYFLNGSFNNYEKINISNPSALNHFVVEANYIKNYDFSKFTSLESIWVNHFANIPVYGTSYEGKNLQNYRPENVTYNKYSIKRQWDLSNSNDSDTITGEIGKYRTVTVYSSNLAGANTECKAIENPTTDNNVKISNLDFNGLIYYDAYFDLHFMNITSNKYEINEDTAKIDVGFDDDETILNNLVINQDSNLAVLKIEDSRLQLIAHNQVFKEFKLIRSIENPKTGYIGAGVMLLVITTIAGVSFVNLKKKKQKLY